MGITYQQGWNFNKKLHSRPQIQNQFTYSKLLKTRAGLIRSMFIRTCLFFLPEGDVTGGCRQPDVLEIIDGQDHSILH
jgi:hypothetical protein